MTPPHLRPPSLFFFFLRQNREGTFPRVDSKQKKEEERYRIGARRQDACLWPSACGGHRLGGIAAPPSSDTVNKSIYKRGEEINGGVRGARRPRR